MCLREGITRHSTMQTFIHAIFILSCVPLSESICTFPYNYWLTSGQDSWLSSEMGSVKFTSVTINEWPVYTFGSFTFTCEINSGTKYVARSNSFTRYNLPFEVFLCLDLTELSSVKYSYYQPTAELSDAGYERVAIYLEGKTISAVTDICDVTDYTTLPYHIFMKEGYISTAKQDCPSIVQLLWSYEYDEGSGNVCTGSSYLDVCTDTTKMSFDYTLCSQQQAYSADGKLNCIHSTTSGSTTYLNMYNLDTTVDGSTTYRFMCYTMTQDGTSINATQYPKYCPAGGNTSLIGSPGALVDFAKVDDCPVEVVVTPDTTMATVGAVLAVLFVIIIIAIIIAVVMYCKKQRKKRLEEERIKKAEEEERLRIEKEEQERLRLEEGALTPRMDLGFPDDSIYDISRLMMESEEMVSPSTVKPAVSENAPEKQFQGFDADYMDIKTIMEGDEWLEARKRHEDVDELEKGETRTQSAIRRMKDLAKKKKKKRGKKKDGFDTEDETDDEHNVTERNRRELIIDLMGTDYEPEDSDLDDELDTERKRRKKAGIDFDNETDDVKAKKKKKKKKKKKLGLYGLAKINRIPLRQTLRKKKIDPEYVLENGEIHLPLYRDDPKLKHLPPLQRVNRKKDQKLWADMFGDIHGGESLDLDAMSKARMSENKWKLLLEELYSDKKYLDYARQSSAGRRVERDINKKSGEGLDYLYGRAKYWEEQPNIQPRPLSRYNTSTPRTPRGTYIRTRNTLPRSLTPIKRQSSKTPETQSKKEKRDKNPKNDEDQDETEC